MFDWPEYATERLSYHIENIESGKSDVPSKLKRW